LLAAAHRSLRRRNPVELIYLPDQNRLRDFDPCKKFAEHQARVTYTARAGKTYDGEISSIQLSETQAPPKAHYFFS